MSDCSAKMEDFYISILERFPEMTELVGMDHGPHHPEGDPFIHSVFVLGHLPKDASTVLATAALLHDLGKARTQAPHKTKGHATFHGHAEVSVKMVKPILERSVISDAEKEDVLYLIGNHMKMHVFTKMRRFKQKELMQHRLFPDLLALYRADCKGTGDGSDDGPEIVEGIYKEYLEREEKAAS